MLDFSGRGILLDIEGTTSSISFVYDVMFPFARRELAGYLRDQWGAGELSEACELIARDAGHDSFAAWVKDTSPDDARRLVQDEVLRLMDGDVKATGLKQLQGLIWRAGFESGEMRAHVYDDVPPALAAWQTAGIDIRIYSSGSTAAQRLFFGHTVAGDLLDHFRGHYDTTTGAKQEVDSYNKIAADAGIPAGELLFISDVLAELAAASTAGLRTALAVRPGNATVAAGHSHPELTSFDQVRLITS